jgi:hypothetical protein
LIWLLAMLKRYTAILLILIFWSVSNLLGQDKLIDNIVSDSLIRKLKIKQVTEKWFYDSLQRTPANTSIEKFNENGQKTQRIHINYSYHKFIDNYEYNLKKNIIVKTQNYYDWSPIIEKRMRDTIVKKSVTKYDINSGRRLKTKPSSFEKFQPKLTFDNYGRVTDRIDTIKCGYNITYYAYGANNKVIERKHYRSHHSENPYLFAVDSLYYNLNGQLVRVTNYYEITMDDGKWEFNIEVVTKYSYYGNGLVQEKSNRTNYKSLNNRDYKTTVYRYEYEFY